MNAEALKQAIENDNAQSTLAILNENKNGLLNEYCVSFLSFLPK